MIIRRTLSRVLAYIFYLICAVYALFSTSAYDLYFIISIVMLYIVLVFFSKKATILNLFTLIILSFSFYLYADHKEDIANRLLLVALILYFIDLIKFLIKTYRL